MKNIKHFLIVFGFVILLGLVYWSMNPKGDIINIISHQGIEFGEEGEEEDEAQDERDDELEESFESVEEFEEEQD